MIVTEERSTIVVVDADLMATARLRDAAERAGWDVLAATKDNLPGRLEGNSVRLLVLDLDRGGKELIDAVSALRDADVDLPRVLAYFSHIDEDLGASALSSGFEAYPRGRFWRSLDELLDD